MSFDFQLEAPEEQFDFQLESDQTDQKPGQLERSLSQFSVDLPAAARATPRVLLEAPRFFSDVADIVAERVQQPLDKSKIPGATEGPSILQRLLPGVFPEPERKPDEDIFRPGQALRGLIPEQVQQGFQSFKEAEVGGVPLFPGIEQAREEVTGQFTDPDSFLRKTLPGLFGEEPLEFTKSATEIEGLLTPENLFEETQQRALQFGVPGALLGGGAVGPTSAGFGLGLTDIALEKGGASEDERKVAAMLFATFFSQAGEAVSAADVIGAVKSSAKKAGIETPIDLSVKLLSPRAKNINTESLKTAQAEGINPTLASVTEGGALQFGANTLSNNFITKNIFDQSVKQMGQDIQSAIERKIETISPQEFLDLTRISETEAGTRPFYNPVRLLTDSLSEDSLSKFETGDAVQTRLNEIADGLKRQAGDLFNAVKQDQSLRVPLETRNVFNTINRIISQQGRIASRSPEGQALVGTLESLRTSFNPKTTRNSIRDAISQVEDLNRVIDFDAFLGGTSKQLIPIRQALIDSIDSQLRGIGREDLANAWENAKSQYRDLAENFGRENRPVFDALNTQKPELIVQNAKTRSGMESFLRAFSRSNEVERTYFNLQKKAIEEISGQDVLAVRDLSDFAFTREKVASLNELRPIMQMDAQLLINEIGDLTNTLKTGQIATRLDLDAIRSDVLNSLARGELPTKTLQRMNTLEGIRDVRSSLNTTPQGRGFLSALEKQKARELMLNDSRRPDGSVILTKINKNVQNPSNKQKLKLFLSKKPFEQLQEIGKFTDKAIEGDRAFKNFSNTATVQQNTALLGELYRTGKLLSTGTASLFILGALKTAGSFGSIYSFAKLYTNPRFINAMSRVSRVAAEAKKTPANARIYNDSVINLLDVVRDILPADELQELEKLNQDFTENEKPQR